MNVVQALGVAAAALMVGLSAGGVAPAKTVSQIAAEAQALVRPAALCAAVEQVAAGIDAWEARRAEGDSDPQPFAARINAIRADALPHSMLNVGAVA
jgi:hypothetical protein